MEGKVGKSGSRGRGEEIGSGEGRSGFVVGKGEEEAGRWGGGGVGLWRHYPPERRRQRRPVAAAAAAAWAENHQDNAG